MTLGTIAAAVAVFAGTDIDDLVVLTALFLAGRATGRPTVRAVVTGQYLGILTLVAGSLLVAAGLLVIPDRWVGLLGLIPIALGIRGLFAARSASAPVVATGVASVAAVTIANGADNIAVYVPLFRDIGIGASLVTIATFAAMVAVWLAVAYRLGTLPRVVRLAERIGQWLVPAVFIAIGVIIIVHSGLL